MALRASDRDALLKVAKGRFEILGIEYNKREDQLRRQIREEVREESKEAISLAKSQAEDVRIRYIEWRRQKEDEEKEFADERTKLIEKFSEQKIAISFNRWDDTNSFNVQVQGEAQIVEERVEAIKKTAELNGGRSLREIELRVNEGIITAGFDDNSDAKAVLAEIPEIDQILPMTAAPRAELASG